MPTDRPTAASPATLYEPWTFDALWNKAVLYAQRAHEKEGESDEFGLWLTLTLELTARAALAYTHPALGADPRTPDSVLVAFGFGDAAKSARSAAASLVFERCTAVIDAFSSADAQQCTKLVDLRNRELHTGELVFGGWAAESLAETYRLLRVLAGHAGQTLEDLLGEESGKAAVVVVAAAEEKNTKEVTKKLTTAKTYFFDVLVEAERGEQRDRAVRASRIWPTAVDGSKPVTCPVCSSQASLHGNVVRTSPEQLDGFELVSNHTHQPTAFACAGCRLDLPSLREIYVAAKVNPAFKPLTSPFTLEVRIPLDEFASDPADF